MTTVAVWRCYYSGCLEPVVLTRSWLNGPTVHACTQHSNFIQRPPLPGQVAQARLL